MIRFILLALVLITSQVYACEEIKKAHSNLINTNFMLNKHYIMHIDDELQIEQSDKVTFDNGEINYTDSKIIFVEENYNSNKKRREFFTKTSFSCDDISFSKEIVTIEQKKDGMILRTQYKYQPNTNLLVPLETRMEGEVGMLFMSWSINAVMTYSDFTKL